MHAAARYVFVAVMLAASPAFAQSSPPATTRDLLIHRWNDVGEKIVRMAEEFPENKFDYRPAADVRTFGDVLRHVGFWNLYVIKTATGEKIDPNINELSKSEYASKASLVKVLKDTVAQGSSILKQGPAELTPKAADLWVTFIEHSGEHYGQLVVYYRLNGIVPPASRGH
jgi:hypothetical protein